VRWSPTERGGPAAQDEAQRGEVRLKFNEGARQSGSHRRGGGGGSGPMESQWKTMAPTALEAKMLPRRDEGVVEVEVLKQCNLQRKEEINGEF
jgi:hypothetical protein